MQWIAGQDAPSGHPITYIVAHIDIGSEPYTIVRNDNIFSTLLYIQRNADATFGNMTTSLTANTTTLENGTKIICRTKRGNTVYGSSRSFLYFAGIRKSVDFLCRDGANVRIT